MCRIWWFLAVLRSFFHSSLSSTFSCHPSPPTILPSSLTSSCRLFLRLLLNLVVPKFIYNTLFGFYFLPFSVHVHVWYASTELSKASSFFIYMIHWNGLLLTLIGFDFLYPFSQMLVVFTCINTSLWILIKTCAIPMGYSGTSFFTTILFVQMFLPCKPF